MNRKEFLKQFNQTLKEMSDIVVKKNKDYTGNGDAFKNFQSISILTDNMISPEEGILVRMTDKINRIATLIYQDNAVKDEKIQDTLLDLAVYSIILKTYLNQDVL